MITNVLASFHADGQDKLADWLENNIEEYLVVIDCSPEVQKRLRIMAAKAMDLSDEWEGITGKATISPEKLRQTAEMLKAASSQPKKTLLNLTRKRVLLQ